MLNPKVPANKQFTLSFQNKLLAFILPANVMFLRIIPLGKHNFFLRGKQLLFYIIAVVCLLAIDNITNSVILLK